MSGVSGIRILIVDNDEPILLALKDFFQAHEYQADVARDIPTARVLLNLHSYHVLISDLCLSDNDTESTLGFISTTRERSPRTRIIILTGYATPEVETEALNRGADRVVLKPLPLPELEGIVRKVLTKHGDIHEEVPK